MSIEEVICVFELQARLELKNDSDPSFRKRWGQQFSVATKLIGEMRAQSFPYIPPSAWKQKAQHLLSKDFLPGSHTYYGWSRNPKRKSLIRVIVPNPLRPPKRIPEKRRIGVGYRDSGNRRDVAKDGVTYTDLMKSDSSRIKGSPEHDPSPQRINLFGTVEKRDPSPRHRGK